MSKKNKIMIVITIIVCGLLLVSGLVVGMFTVVNKASEEFYLTTEETQAYQDIEGYTSGYSKYENTENGLSFLYPVDWILVMDSNEEVYIANPYIQEGQPGDIYFTILSEEDSPFKVDDYSDFKKSIMLDGKMEFDGVWYEGTNVEQCLIVNDKKTFMWYNNMHPVDLEEYQTFDLQYYSFLEDGNIVFVSVVTDDEDVFNKIVGSLKY